MPLAPDRKYRYLSNEQADYITNLVNARFAIPDEAGRAVWRDRFRAIRTNADVSKVISDLKEIPTLVEAHNARVEAERQARLNSQPTEDGYYRNPQTGELFRISHGARHNLIVSKYSLTGGPRRLVADTSEIVKGKWKRLGKMASREAITKIQKDWLIDATSLAKDFAYGFCPLHHGPLTDGVSVTLGYGKDCAEKYGLPWGEEAAQAVLAAAKEVSTS